MGSETFEVYRTSAGAGKTYTIVREFIKMNLTGESDFDSVAAITFTNKAANEMKERILEYLYAISTDQSIRSDISAMIEYLGQETKKSKDEIVESANQILTKILHQYSRFSITTIDSFIHDILRIFSHDLKLPDNFTVETDTAMLAEYIVSELLANLENTKSNPETAKLSRYIVELALSRFEERDNWDITYELTTFSKLLFSEEGLINMPTLASYNTNDFSELSAKLDRFVNSILKEIRQYGSEAVEAIRNEGFTDRDLYQTSKGIYGFFSKAAHANYDYDMIVNSFVQKTIEEDKWVTKGPDLSQELKHKLLNLFIRITENPGIPFLSLAVHMKTQTGPLALLGKMQSILKEYEVTNQSLPISEFNRYIADVVRFEPAPFIYERLGQKFRHFLIDEFQDTSVTQWQNFLPLIENSLSQNNYTMIVGDVKQSIYRFRNGEMEQLMKLPYIYNKPDHAPHFNDIEQVLTQHFSDKSKKPEFKNINYRSGQHIVEFNNKHFEYISNTYSEKQYNPFVPKAYDQLKQNFYDNAADKGHVNLYPLKSDQYKNYTLQLITEIIETHPRKSDIAILTRGNASAKQIASHLMQQNPPVPVISSESLELSFSPAVNFIANMLRWIHDPNNHIAIIGAYTYLQLHHPHVRNLYPEYHCWLNDVLIKTDKKEKNKEFLRLLKDAGFAVDIVKLASLPVNQIVTFIIRQFELSVPTDAYVLFFQNKLNDFLNQSNESLPGVLKWWNEKGRQISISVPEGTDAVWIFTIHKSKGLQFPVVIYPFADFRLRNTNSHIWTPTSLFPQQILKEMNMPGLQKFLLKLSLHKKLPECELSEFLGKEIMKQELDALNMHYVAMTRAKHELHVLFKETAEKKRDTAPAFINNILSDFIREERSLFHETDENIPVFRYGKNNVFSTEESEFPDTQPVLSNYYIRTQGVMNIRTIAAQKSKAVHTGELFHEFMATTDNLDNLQEQFDVFCTKFKPGQHETEILRNMLTQFTENKEIRELFASDMKHLNETTIIDQEKTFRPDKIVYNNERTFVVDFKTGKKSEKHIKQIENYKRLLAEMQFRSILSVLVYVSETNLEIIHI